jgi:hypothetical protein
MADAGKEHAGTCSPSATCCASRPSTAPSTSGSAARPARSRGRRGGHGQDHAPGPTPGGCPAARVDGALRAGHRPGDVQRLRRVAAAARRPRAAAGRTSRHRARPGGGGGFAVHHVRAGVRARIQGHGGRSGPDHRWTTCGGATRCPLRWLAYVARGARTGRSPSVLGRTRRSSRAATGPPAATGSCSI